MTGDSRLYAATADVLRKRDRRLMLLGGLYGFALGLATAVFLFLASKV